MRLLLFRDRLLLLIIFQLIKTTNIFLSQIVPITIHVHCIYLILVKINYLFHFKRNFTVTDTWK
jgi:hypothetical protein